MSLRIFSLIAFSFGRFDPERRGLQMRPSRQLDAAVVAYYALVRTDHAEIAPGHNTMEAAWFPVDEVPSALAFDNDEIPPPNAVRDCLLY